MRQYLARHLDLALQSPRRGRKEPLLHLLACGMQDDIISREEALGITTVLFGAGGESTAALIGSCFKWLSQDQQLADHLREHSDDIPRFVEEITRLEPPFKFHYRAVRTNCKLAGFTLQPGDRLLLSWAAANRDPQRFEQPDKLGLKRKYPKQHMAYGRGLHFCIGAVLARLEGRIMVEEILSGTRLLKLSDDQTPVYTRSIFIRRLERLSLDFQ